MPSSATYVSMENRFVKNRVRIPVKAADVHIWKKHKSTQRFVFIVSYPHLNCGSNKSKNSVPTYCQPCQYKHVKILMFFSILYYT